MIILPSGICCCDFACDVQVPGRSHHHKGMFLRKKALFFYSRHPDTTLITSSTLNKFKKGFKGERIRDSGSSETCAAGCAMICPGSTGDSATPSKTCSAGRITTKRRPAILNRPAFSLVVISYKQNCISNNMT